MLNEFRRTFLLAGLLLTAAVGMTLQLHAETPEHKYTAILIWGTDGPKPPEKELKDVDTKLTEKIKRIFKWKNYYEVKRQNVNLKTGETKHLDMSHKCSVKLHLTEKEGMEVELWGDGKSVYKGKQSMPLKDILILAGDDKNATAWFVVLKPQ